MINCSIKSLKAVTEDKKSSKTFASKQIICKSLQNVKKQQCIIKLTEIHYYSLIPNASNIRTDNLQDTQAIHIALHKYMYLQCYDSQAMFCYKGPSSGTISSRAEEHQQET